MSLNGVYLDYDAHIYIYAYWLRCLQAALSLFNIKIVLLFWQGHGGCRGHIKVHVLLLAGTIGLVLSERCFVKSVILHGCLTFRDDVQRRADLVGFVTFFTTSTVFVLQVLF